MSNHTQMRMCLVLSAAAALIFATTPRALAVDADQLSQEFYVNPELFIQKYKGQQLTVTGRIFDRVLDVPHSSLGSGSYVALSGEYDNTYCFLNDADRKRAITLFKGAPLTVVGVYVGSGQADIGLDPCTFK